MAEEKTRPLSVKQRAFARERASGKSQAQAYYDAGYSHGNSHIAAEVNGRKLERDERVKALIKKYQEQAEAGAVLDRKARQALLTQLALDETEKTDNRLRATDMLNRMSGDYTDRVEQTYSGSLNLSYEERRKMLMEGLKKDA